MLLQRALAAGRSHGQQAAGACAACALARGLTSSSSGGGGSQQQQGCSSSCPAGSWWAAATGAAAAAGLLLSTSAAADARRPPAAAAAKPGAQQQQQPQDAGVLPEYTAEEVAKHRTPAERVWVTYKDGVYDVTDFIAQHPGGAVKIMLAAGGSVEPFWGLYQQHQKPDVQAIIAQYRIGSLKGGAKPAAALENPYRHEPARHPALLVRSGQPFNGETPAELLGASLLTPAEVFFVRHHLPVPDVAADGFELKVEGVGMRSLSLSLAQLQASFKKVEVAATVQCTGNRRAEMKAVAAPGGSTASVKGLDWDTGAIGTATWGGVRLRDVLLAAGLQPGDPAVQHIHFYGLDVDEAGVPYAASIPAAKALAEAGDVLLAWEMNGQPMPRDHGGPLRVIVPGTTGARSVKWLGRVVASTEECQGHWQQRDYKTFSLGTDWDNLDWSSAPAMQEMPVTSAITEPAPGAVLSTYDGEVTLRGYAWSGGGADIVRVDVSADGGKTWAPAALRRLPGSRPGRAWAWALWEAVLPLPDGFSGPLTLVAKATDSSFNTQPEAVASVWNVRGLANNAWHRVDVTVSADAE